MVVTLGFHHQVQGLRAAALRNGITKIGVVVASRGGDVDFGQLGKHRDLSLVGFIDRAALNLLVDGQPQATANLLQLGDFGVTGGQLAQGKNIRFPALAENARARSPA